MIHFCGSIKTPLFIPDFAFVLCAGCDICCVGLLDIVLALLNRNKHLDGITESMLSWCKKVTLLGDWDNDWLSRRLLVIVSIYQSRKVRLGVAMSYGPSIHN